MRKLTSHFSVLAFALLLSACGVFQGETADATRGWSASKLYAEARDELSSGNYDKSIEYFEKLESRYPFGLYAQQAQMEIAYAHYRQGEQPEALTAAERFIRLHPNHPNVDYMYYLRGLVNFNDQVSLFNFLSEQDLSERDPKAAREAFDSFKQLVDRFPDSKYAKDANERLAYLVNAMAQHEVHVARYYYRRGAYVASAERAQTAVQDYPEAPAIEEALYLMMRSYDALDLPQLRDDAQRVFEKNFPHSDFGTGKRKDGKSWWKFW